MQTTTTAAPRKVATRTPTRTKQLRDLHQSARNAGFDPRPGKPGRAAYEAEVMKAIGRTSTRQASRAERIRVAEHFNTVRCAKNGLTYAHDDYSDEACLELLGL